MASGPAWARRARGGARCSAGWCRCLRPACGPLRLLGPSGKGLPGLLPGAPTDRPPRELSGRERGWHARGPLVLPFCAQSTCPRCAQRPWQRLLQQAERPLRGGGGSGLPGAPRPCCRGCPRSSRLAVRRAAAPPGCRRHGSHSDTEVWPAAGRSERVWVLTRCRAHAIQQTVFLSDDERPDTEKII